MNFETYKQMTKAQKEEWNYKFAKTPKLGFSYWFVLYLVVCSNLMIFTGAITVLVPNDSFIPYRVYVIDYMLSAIYLIKVISWIIVIDIFVFLLKVITYCIILNRWLKKNKIKKVRINYFKRLKGALKWN